MKSALRTLWRRLPVVVVVMALIGAAVGSLYFMWAFRSCPLRLEPGTVIRYRLDTTLTPLDADLELLPNQAVSEVRQLDCMVLNEHGDVAVVAQDGRQSDRLRILRLANDGSVRVIESEDGSGSSIGFFDFDMLRLPVDSSQSWSVDVEYGYLPPGRRQVTGQVRRLGAEAHPRFELRFDPMEWVEPRPREHFRSLRNARCRYRYNSAYGLVSEASLSARYGIEGAHAPQYVAVNAQLTLEGVSQNQQRAVALQDVISLEPPEAQRFRQDQRQAVFARLAEAAEGAPRLAARLRQLAGVALPAAQAWYVQVASVRAERREPAMDLVRSLQEAGWTAALRESGRYLTIVVGPFADRDAHVTRVLEEELGQQVLWLAPQ